MTLRSFLAAEFDARTRQWLERAWREVRQVGGSVRWVRPEGLHATLAFFGDVTREQVAALTEGIRTGAAGRGPIPVRVGGLGGFPQATRARVVWVGVEDPSGRLAELQVRLTERFSALGFAADERGFHPHVTLGRAKAAPVSIAPHREALAAAGVEATEGMIERVVLFQSTLEPDGARYTPLTIVNLE